MEHRYLSTLTSEILLKQYKRKKEGINLQGWRKWKRRQGHTRELGKKTKHRWMSSIWLYFNLLDACRGGWWRNHVHFHCRILEILRYIWSWESGADCMWRKTDLSNWKKNLDLLTCPVYLWSGRMRKYTISRGSEEFQAGAPSGTAEVAMKGLIEITGINCMMNRQPFACSSLTLASRLKISQEEVGEVVSG